MLLYKSLNGKAKIHTDDLVPQTRYCRNQHSRVFQITFASLEACKCSFFLWLSGTCKLLFIYICKLYVEVPLSFHGNK